MSRFHRLHLKCELGLYTIGIFLVAQFDAEYTDAFVYSFIVFTHFAFLFLFIIVTSICRQLGSKRDTCCLRP